MHMEGHFLDQSGPFTPHFRAAHVVWHPRPVDSDCAFLCVNGIIYYGNA
jgi:hypothetical protein